MQKQINGVERAISIAIENGWKPFTGYLRKKFEMEDNCAIFYDRVNVRRFHFSDMVLDPLFWQALGKGLGWEEHRCVIDTHPGMCGECWSSQWHRFIDHLAEGKDINGFFEKRLK